MRSGSDVVKAAALGARAVLSAGADLRALAAAGEAWVRHILEVFRDGIAPTRALLGCPSVAAPDRTYMRVPNDWRDAGA